MNLIQFLKILLVIIFTFMVWIIATTSLESNLFKEWNFLGSIPWMKATLYDFYANVLILYLWVFYKEPQWYNKLLWLVVLTTLGSPGTCLYILKELFLLKKHEGLQTLLIRQNS